MVEAEAEVVALRAVNAQLRADLADARRHADAEEREAERLREELHRWRPRPRGWFHDPDDREAA